MNIWFAILPKAETRIYAVMFRYKNKEGRNDLGYRILEILPLQWLPCNILETCHTTPASMPLVEQFLPSKTPFPDWFYLPSALLKGLRSSSNCISFMKLSHPWNHLIHETSKISSPYRTSLFAEVLMDKLIHLSFLAFWYLIIFILTVNLVYTLTKWHHI